MAKSEKLKIVNNEGFELDARLELPLNQKPKAYAIFAHCFTCNKNFSAVKNITKALTHHGIAVVRFDFTGLGRSEGDFSDSNFTSNISDLLAVSSFLKENYHAPELIVGHSLGGTASLFAASELDSVKAVATIGSPSMPEHVTHLFSSVADELERKGEAKVKIGIQEIKIKKQFVEDVKSRDINEAVKRNKKSYLIMHSPQDLIVGIDNAADLYGLLNHPKSFVSLDGADHMLSDNADSIYAGEVIANWASRYLSKQVKEKLSTDSHQVSVRLNTEDIFTSEVAFKNHYLTADEPETYGGNDFGPSPYELVSAGLGACTVMTLRMYARRKKWDLKEVKVDINHGKEHFPDCEECETKDKQIDVFNRELSIEGDLDESQRMRLLEIADRCPVHRTLEKGSEMRTKLIDN